MYVTIPYKILFKALNKNKIQICIGYFVILNLIICRERNVETCRRLVSWF